VGICDYVRKVKMAVAMNKVVYTARSNGVICSISKKMLEVVRLKVPYCPGHFLPQGYAKAKQRV
jgi:hypothetical protein